MLRLNPDAKRAPFGGHHYPEHGMTFKGESFKEVLKDVADFRRNNNLPAGDPEQEVLFYYASKFPWMVRADHGAVEPPQVKSQYHEFRDWVHKTWRKPPVSSVTTKQARERWAVCEKCPFNVPYAFRETDESSELVRRSFLLRRGITVPSFLGFCALHKADLGAFSFFEDAKSYSSKKDSTQQPAPCWVL